MPPMTTASSRDRVLAHPRRARRRSRRSSERLYNEFPSQIEAITDPVARRTFLKLMGASLALAGVGACTRQPAGEDRPVRPAARRPRPGQAAVLRDGDDARRRRHGPARREPRGPADEDRRQPDHPASLGATDVFAQASILGLYDPDRSQTLTNLGEIRPWPAFPRRRFAAALAAQRPLGGAGLRILTETVTSPTLAAQIRDLLAAFPVGEVASVGPARPRQRRARRAARVRRARRHAVPPRSGRRHRLARRRLPRRADPASLRYARDFAAAPARSRPSAMNRLYAVESMPTLDGLARRPPAARQAERDRGHRARAWPRPSARRSGAGSGAGARRPDDGRSGSTPSPRICRRTAARASSSPATRSRRSSTRSRTRSTQALGNVGTTRRLHRPGRGGAGRPARVAARAGRRHGRRPGRRCSSSSAATRSTPRRPTSSSRDALDKVAAARPPRPVRRRDVGAVPLARARGALPRSVERRARATTARCRSSSR